MRRTLVLLLVLSWASVAGAQGLIRDVTDKARDYTPPGVDLFDVPHDQPITWEHLLRHVPAHDRS